MRVDLLRQLDEWGSHFEGSIDHVTAAEVLESAEAADETVQEAGARSTGPAPRWRAPVRYAGAIAVVLAVIVALPNLFTAVDEPTTFNSVGRELGGSDFATTTAATATTAAPGTTVPGFENEGLPPIGDALANGWNVLTTALNAVAIAAAFLLPFIWLPVLALVGTWWWRRRKV